MHTPDFMIKIDCSNNPRCQNKMLVPEENSGPWFCSSTCALEMEFENYGNYIWDVIVDVAMPNLYEEARKHFNEPILICFELCRCIGYAEDEEDCYLIVHSPSRGIYWNTFVGGYTYLACLKEQGITNPKYPKFPGEIWTDYSRLDSLLELNGVPKAKRFLLIEKRRTYIKMDDTPDEDFLDEILHVTYCKTCGRPSNTPCECS